MGDAGLAVGDAVLDRPTGFLGVGVRDGLDLCRTSESSGRRRRKKSMTSAVFRTRRRRIRRRVRRDAHAASGDRRRPWHRTKCCGNLVCVSRKTGTCRVDAPQGWNATRSCRSPSDLPSFKSSRLQLQTGVGLPRDDTEAASWALRAADRSRITWMHSCCSGPCTTRAGACRRTTTKRSHGSASLPRRDIRTRRFSLGHSYSVGHGVIQDGVLACIRPTRGFAEAAGVWARPCAHHARPVNGIVKFMRKQSRLQCSELTRAEMGEARRLAREWNERKGADTQQVLASLVATAHSPFAERQALRKTTESDRTPAVTPPMTRRRLVDVRRTKVRAGYAPRGCVFDLGTFGEQCSKYRTSLCASSNGGRS